jgi:enediyne biosynthesis protein E8
MSDVRTAELSRRRLLQIVSAAALAVPLTGLRMPEARAVPLPHSLDAETLTLEAWSDTMVPGEKRSRGDRAIAGAATGPGAVQAGAVDMMRFGPVGLAPALPALAGALNAEATRYAVAHAVVPAPGVPPFVALPFDHRTRLALELLDGGRPDQLAWYGLAGIAMLAFHTAGHLHTVDAVRSGHPGLVWLDFPMPDADGLWRYPLFSYGRTLADVHPATTSTGQPA